MLYPKTYNFIYFFFNLNVKGPIIKFCVLLNRESKMVELVFVMHNVTAQYELKIPAM